jgi:hypothetical protein
MSDAMTRAPSLAIRVRRVVIRGASGLEARRLADALRPSLERVFTAAHDGTPASRAVRSSADRVSNAVREAIVAQLDPQR